MILLLLVHILMLRRYYKMVSIHFSGTEKAEIDQICRCKLHLEKSGENESLHPRLLAHIAKSAVDRK